MGALSKYQKNEINVRLSKFTLVIQEFEVYDNQLLTTIAYKPFPKLYFVFERIGLDHDLFGWGSTNYTQEPRFTKAQRQLPFDYALDAFEIWLKDVYACKFELSEYDPWSNIVQSEVPNNSFNETNEMFESATKAQHKIDLDNLREAVSKKFNLMDERYESLFAAFENLKDKLDKLSKPSWRRFANGLWLDLLKDIGTDKENVQEIMNFVRETFTSENLRLPPLL